MNLLQRIVHIVNDGDVLMADANNSKKFSIIRIMQKEQTVLDEIKTESLSGASLTIYKTRELIENIVNDLKPESTPDVNVSASISYYFIKRYPELKTSKPKIVEASMLSVSRQQVLKPLYDMFYGFHQTNNFNNALIYNVDESTLRVSNSSNRNVVHPDYTKQNFEKSAGRMANSMLIVEVAVDGQSLPFVILWSSLKLFDDLKLLQSSNLEIWPNKCGWMESSTFRKYALTILLSSVKERRQRISLDESHCLLLINSNVSRADQTIWREFRKENVDVVTFVPRSTHACRPLDRGVFAVLKSEISSQYEALSFSSSEAKSSSLVEALQHSIH